MKEITETTAVVETPSYNSDFNTGEVEETTVELELEKEGEEWKITGFPSQ